MSEYSPNTYELGLVRIKLREDIGFTLQEYDGVTCYVVEDNRNSRFYRIGLPEYAFISLLDGQTTLHEALGHTAKALGPDAFSENDAAGICKWLIDSQLATSDDSLQTDRLLEVADRAKRRARMQWLNPLMIKVPLGSPEPLLRQVAPWMMWLVSRPIVVVWLIICAIATYQLVGRWHDLGSDANLVLSRNNWIWLGLTLLLLKIIHELAHALTCRRFGGTVREAGFVFILFAPIPYVDVTSSWRMPSKWQRIAISAAGMYVELFVAAVATLVWCNTQDQVVRHIAYNTMIMSGVTTLLFNANFLMRFDGYYIFADLLEIPNLYSLGQQYLSYVGRRYFLGIPAMRPRWPIRRATIIKVYGIASFLWRIMVCVGLVIAAEALFYGAGIVLSILAIALWVAFPLVRFVRYLSHRNGKEQTNLVWFAATAGTTGSLLLITFTAVPWPWRIEAPAVVRFAPLTNVRAESPGFVRQIHVKSGDQVQAGQALLTLENAELQVELSDLNLSIQQSELRCRNFYREGRLAAYQAENKMRAALESRANQRQKQIDQLTIRAPRNGVVMGDELISLAGRFVTIGTEVLKVADESQKELLISVAQEDRKHFASALDTNVRIQTLATQPYFVSRLATVNPRASTDIDEPALAAISGGPLPVRAQGAHESNGSTKMKLLEPRFTGTVSLGPTQSKQLKAGQTALVQLSETRGSIGAVLWSHVRKWIRNRTLRAI